MFNSFRLAISFLTILPVYKKMANNQELARSVSYYPLVGLLLGAVAAGSCYGLRSLGLGISADVVALVIMITITGGLHMDGLMDTADGIFSGRDREKKLEIMKDSRVGAMGVIAFGTVFLLKIAFLYELTLGPKLMALILAPAAGRWAMTLCIIHYPYARPTGLGACLQQAGYGQLMVASIILIAASWGLAGFMGLAVLAAIVPAVVVTAGIILKCLGGMTGDTYGATGELIETWTICIILLGQQMGLL